MAFNKKTWANNQAGGTPLDASGLNDLESRIDDGLGAIGVGIVDMGSNADGRYVKFENGLLICWKLGLKFTKVSNYYLHAVWDFPVKMIDSDYFAIPLAQGDSAVPIGRFNATNLGVNGVTFFYQNISAPFTSASYSFNTFAFAIGRWK